MVEIHIQNIVASTAIAKELDLNKIAKSLPSSKYDPDKFPGLIYHINKPKVAFLLFQSGRIVCTGAKTIEEVHKAIDILCKTLKKAGQNIIEPEIEIQNIVASADFNTKINLSELSLSLGLENIEYEPEIFPGMVYRLEELGVVFLFFGSGKIVCTGARRKEDIEKAIKIVIEELGSRGFL
ncbi:TATA-box-binding protein [Thermoplasmatales archaeon ex4484_30]|nr:MAG: TATA-box-binding protein [Thermoplasmatales archaeon ex4484_30]RLC65836.1 MAG: TATA-box-binding protein [Chloroflexota bacterium]